MYTGDHVNVAQAARQGHSLFCSEFIYVWTNECNICESDTLLTLIVSFITLYIRYHLHFGSHEYVPSESLPSLSQF